MDAPHVSEFKINQNKVPNETSNENSVVFCLLPMPIPGRFSSEASQPNEGDPDGEQVDQLEESSDSVKLDGQMKEIQRKMKARRDAKRKKVAEERAAKKKQEEEEKARKAVAEKLRQSTLVRVKKEPGVAVATIR